jgi:hypothetical protein
MVDPAAAQDPNAEPQEGAEGGPAEPSVEERIAALEAKIDALVAELSRHVTLKL